MSNLVFKKENYRIMYLGIVMLIIGFTVMCLDKTQYGFGFMGITLGPIIILASFAIQFWAILHKPKKKE